MTRIANSFNHFFEYHDHNAVNHTLPLREKVVIVTAAAFVGLFTLAIGGLFLAYKLRNFFASRHIKQLPKQPIATSASIFKSAGTSEQVFDSVFPSHRRESLEQSYKDPSLISPDPIFTSVKESKKEVSDEALSSNFKEENSQQKLLNDLDSILYKNYPKCDFTVEPRREIYHYQNHITTRKRRHVALSEPEDMWKHFKIWPGTVVNTPNGEGIAYGIDMVLIKIITYGFILRKTPEQAIGTI